MTSRCSPSKARKHNSCTEHTVDGRPLPAFWGALMHGRARDIGGTRLVDVQANSRTSKSALVIP